MHEKLLKLFPKKKEYSTDLTLVREHKIEATENYERKEREKYVLNVQKVERFIEQKDSMCSVHSASAVTHKM